LTKASGTGTIWIQVSNIEANFYQAIIEKIPVKKEKK